MHYLNFAVWAFASLHGLMGGTDRGAAWLAILYGVSVATVLMLLLWRFGGRARRGSRRRAAVTVVALPLLIVGPLRHSPPLWNATNVDETPHGHRHPQRHPASSRSSPSSGRRTSPQKLVVRADLLVAPEQLEKTSLQLEYLPSGDICRGRVTKVSGNSFSGTCRFPNGGHRTLDATWVSNEAGTGVVGDIRLRG